ncbi:WBP2NL, partial [Cervus elaphus hippelaphus]
CEILKPNALLSVLKQCEDVDLCFLQKPVVFVTSHLVNDPMLSFMMPFGLMGDCTIEQPIFAPNYIKGTIQAAPGGKCPPSEVYFFSKAASVTVRQPLSVLFLPPGGWEGQAVFKLSFRKGGGWEGQAVFKLSFRKGGAIEFAQLMVKAASAAARGIPLGSVNYWFDTSGLYIITVPGAAACSPQTSCPGPFTTFSELNLEDSPSKGHPKTEVTVRRKTQP